VWLLGATVTLCGLVAYGLWSAIATRADLVAARNSGDQLQSALTSQDSAGSDRALRTMHGRFSDAHDRTDGLLWGAASHLPFVGDDVLAVRTVSAVGDTLSEGALARLVRETGGGFADRLVPRQGRVDIAAIESLAPDVERAHQDLRHAAGRLDDVRLDGLTRWVEPSYVALTNKVDQADDAMDAADHVVKVLPTMLGKDRPRSYLLLFNNNAEIRATGGLPGAFSVIRADKGRISLTNQGAAVDFPEFPSPVLPQSAAERAIYDGQIAQYFADTNFTPEFPRTAGLVREMWKRTHGEALDGVFSVDAVTLSYLLRATGPIGVPGGLRLTPANATLELINNVYFRIPDAEAQNRFFAEVSRRVFDKVVSGVNSPAQLVTALSQAVREGRIYAHDFNPKVQEELSGSPIAGQLDGGDPRAPKVGVYLNDATGSKMSYYLRNKVRLQAESCAAGEQQFAGTADLTYTAKSPAVKDLNEFVTGDASYGTPKGEQLVLVRIYGSRGGAMTNFRVAGSPTPIETVDDRGRPVATTAVQLRRGETVRISWRLRTGPRQDRPAELSVSPGMTATQSVTRIPSKCSSG
jgi:hypothetical protein